MYKIVANFIDYNFVTFFANTRLKAVFEGQRGRLGTRGKQVQTGTKPDKKRFVKKKKRIIKYILC